MQPFDAGKKPKLEKDHYRDLKKFMEARGWLVEKVTASAYLIGWPDVFACHREFGQRWIEMKRPNVGRLNDDQRRVFMKWHNAGVRIWVVTSVEEYGLLFKEPNWFWYTLPKEMRPS